MEQEYLTAEQVAEKLQMNPTIIRRMLAGGELPGRKIGKKVWRVLDSDLREFMAGKKPPARAVASPARKRKSGD